MNKRLRDVYDICEQYKDIGIRKDDIRKERKQLKMQLRDLDGDERRAKSNIEDNVVASQMRKMFPSLNIVGFQKYEISKNIYMGYYNGGGMTSMEYAPGYIPCDGEYYSDYYQYSYDFCEIHKNTLAIADIYWNRPYQWFVERVAEIECMYLIIAKFKDKDCSLQKFPREIILLILRMVKEDRRNEIEDYYQQQKAKKRY